MLFAWDTAERTGALLNIRWVDFDYVGGTMEAPAEIRKGGRKPMLYRLKPETVMAIEAIREPVRSRVFSWSEGNFYAHYKQLVNSAGLIYEKHKSGPKNCAVLCVVHRSKLRQCNGRASSHDATRNREFVP